MFEGKSYLPQRSELYFTRRECRDGDSKTNSIRGERVIPEGRQVVFCKLWKNFYGVWAEIRWQGARYDVRPEDLVIRVQDVIEHLSPKPGLMAVNTHGNPLRLIGQIPAWDENLNPIASHCWLAMYPKTKEIIQISECDCKCFYEMSEEREESIKYGPYDVEHMDTE